MKGFNSSKIKKFIDENYTGWLFNMPLAVGLLVFTFIPVIYSLVFSLNDDIFILNGNVTMTFIGLKNYVKIFAEDREMGKVIINTVIYTLVSIPLNLVASYFLALLVNTKLKGVEAFRVFYYLPCMIPAVVGGLLWKDMFDTTYGVFNKMLGFIGLGPFQFFSNEKTALSSVFLMNMWGIGGGMILWLSAFKNIGRHYYEAAELDGANAWVKLINITIPMSTSMIFFNIITSVIGTLQYNGTLTFASRDGRGPENSLYMYAVKIYREAFEKDNMGYACSLAWILLIVIGLITVLLFSTSKWVFYGEET